VTGFDKEIGVCLRVAKLWQLFKLPQKPKCEQSSTGSSVTYPDGRPAARLRLRGL